LLLALNQLAPEPNQALLSAKESPLTYLKFFQRRAVSSFAAFGDVDFAGQDVLDLGCGLGANLVHILTLGARRLTALDIDSTQIERTQSVIASCHPDLSPRIQFVAANAARMPFADESFDALVSADTFEHVADLRGSLWECARVLRPGGHLYAYFPPFYAPWGAHMINWIWLPWCQVFFSETTILNVARQLDKEGRSVNSQLPPATRLDLQAGNSIPFVNHLTLCRFRRVVNDIPSWRIVRTRLLPPGWRAGQWLSRLLRPLTWIPLLQEMFTAKAVFVLRKETGA